MNIRILLILVGAGAAVAVLVWLLTGGGEAPDTLSETAITEAEAPTEPTPEAI